jgi:hypothetical protein
MTQQERDIMGSELTRLAFIYGYELPKERISIFINVLIDFVPASLNEYLKAFTKYSEDPKNRFFPNPAQIRQYIKPKLSPDALANESANKIRMAITKYGWPDPNGAKEFMGDLAWRVVERTGGWRYICENHGLDLNPLTFHAQARDSIKSLIEQDSIPPMIDNILTLSPLKLLD